MSCKICYREKAWVPKITEQDERRLYKTRRHSIAISLWRPGEKHIGD